MKIVYIIFATIMFSCSYSQIIDGYGIKLGMSYSKLDRDFKQLDFENETEYKAGFEFSVYANTTIINNINLLTEIGFSQKGYQEEFVKTNDNGEKIGSPIHKESFNYLSVKLAPAYYFELMNVRPYFFLGPKIDIKLGNNSDLDDVRYGENIEDIQFGLSYGFGIKIENLIQPVLLIELSSGYDFKNSWETDYIVIKNISHSLKVGIEF